MGRRGSEVRELAYTEVSFHWDKPKSQGNPRALKVPSPVLEEENSLIEQVALNVTTDDDHHLPTTTLRMWVIGTLTCALLAFSNTFFYFRQNPMVIPPIAGQFVTLYIGRFWAAHVPRRTLFGLELNPGEFNVKEHVLIALFVAQGSGVAYALHVVVLVKKFYKMDLNFLQALLLVMTTQCLGFGWTGVLRRFLVDPAQMWWPGNMAQIALFRTLHEQDRAKPGCLSRMQFFYIVASLSFVYYLLPHYFLGILTCVSWVCLIGRSSITANIVGGGYSGLGALALSFDWVTLSNFNGSPFVTPFFTAINVFVGFIAVTYVVIPALYWGNVWNTQMFPILASRLFRSTGQPWQSSRVMNGRLELDEAAYEAYGEPNMSSFHVVAYGIGFASLTASISHVLLWNGPEIFTLSQNTARSKELDIHTKIIRRNYKSVPESWFLAILFVSLGLSILMAEVWKHTFQFSWWGVLLSAAFAAGFTLPFGIISATTNQTPGLNILTELVWGYVQPGKPIGNAMFKTFGYISLQRSIFFLQSLKLGHYMKTPPQAMFAVMMVSTLVSGVVNVAVTFWLFASQHDLCGSGGPPENNQWTCPITKVFYSASTLWGLIGPARLFGPGAKYVALNWCFLVGALAPLPFFLLAKTFPHIQWLSYVHTPILIGAAGIMPPAGPCNFYSWFILAVVSNHYVFKYRRALWQRYNYLMSAALDTGVAFMAILLFLTLQQKGIHIDWWGNGINSLDNCDLASCPLKLYNKTTGCPLIS